MSEESVIMNSEHGPVTYTSMLRDFTNIGIKPGMNLLVHSSLSSIGWVCGGAVSVIQALEHILTQSGTLIMPAHSSDVSDPAHWGNPPVPESWWEIIRKEMPVFDNGLTPTRGMGKIAESFRKQAGVRRSNHPSASFCAWGRNSDYLLQDTHFDYPQNDQSPLGRLYELDGYVLLIGVDFDKNTSFHLAEYKANCSGKRIVKDGFPLLINGVKEWYEYEDILYYSDDFIQIGKEFKVTNECMHGFIGKAKSLLFSQRTLIDFSVKWMEKNRRE